MVVKLKKVLLVNWDCYPNSASGGVYTWTKSLIDSMVEYEFIVVNQLSNPNANGNYAVPENVTKIIEIPIFGCNRYEEFYNENKPLIPKIHRTTEGVIKNFFVPIYKDFVSTILSDKIDTAHMSDVIVKLHKFLITYDSKKCFEHRLTWETFLEQLNSDPLYQKMTLKEALTAFQLLQRNLHILAIEIPKVDIIHCSLAWVPSLIAIFAKMESKCPVIITEHGVAYRELLLYYNAYMYDEPAKVFWKVFSRNVVKTVYSIADVITPVCNANAIWEEYLGADTSRIRVVYNGVNVEKFKPMEVNKQNKRPTIVCVARVDVFKDIICLIQAIKYVKEHIPDIHCLIYGNSVDLEYSLRCINAIKDLQLEDNVKFMGGTKEPEKVYNMADVVVISSITEGFPFTIIEAMACGRPIVASDVGGVSEALEGCGLLVRSRSPHELAEGIVKLFRDEKVRDELAIAAAKKAKDKFTLAQSVNHFRKLYEETINCKSQALSGLKEVVVQ